MHTSDTPFPVGPKATGISRVEPTLSTPEAGKPKPVAYTLPFAQFLKDDPRVLASPLMSVSPSRQPRHLGLIKSLLNPTSSQRLSSSAATANHTAK